jgi:membrane-associated phospholipid phosphatase
MTLRIKSSEPVSSIRSTPSDRRRFLGRAGRAVVTTALAGTTGRPFLRGIATETAGPAESSNPHSRIEQAYEMREKAALYQRGLPVPNNSSNGDEELYPTKIASYTKALQHDDVGRVVRGDYDSFVNALTTGDFGKIETLVLGGGLKLVNPQAGVCFGLEGGDSHHFGIIAPPAFSSAEQAGELAELYWQALTRDVPFSRYETDPLASLAITDLSRLSNFRGPKIEGQITPQTLFRGNTPGDLNGPYVSQFLWQDVPYGANRITQRIRTVVPAVDYMTRFDHWLAIQNGSHPSNANRLEGAQRFIHTARDLARYVQLDFTYQAFLNACLILLGTSASVDAASPYKSSATQSGFSTFGAPHILDLLAKVANYGLKAAWYQKWYVHRRLRPEEFGGAVHNLRRTVAHYPIHSDILNSKSLDITFSKGGSYLLPQAYAEGSPAHPSYPAGHAVIAGACATVLKVFFDESFEIRKPVEASADGFSLSPYKGLELTVGGELNKLAANISIGRNAAGVHWRSDSIEGLKLGEAVAISLMKEERGCLNENFGDFALTKFDGRGTVV